MKDDNIKKILLIGFLDYIIFAFMVVFILFCAWFKIDGTIPVYVILGSAMFSICVYVILIVFSLFKMIQYIVKQNNRTKIIRVLCVLVVDIITLLPNYIIISSLLLLAKQ